MNAGDLHIRRATAEDSEDIWRWRNDPVTRYNSLDHGAIAWEDHRSWYAEVLRSPNRMIWVGTERETGESIGMVRFDLDTDDSSAVVSINMNPDWRGKGLSALLLTLAMARVAGENPRRFIARVADHNIASVKLFDKCGFELLAREGETFLFQRLAHDSEPEE